MFDFLKRSIPVELIGINSRQVTFRCARSQSEGKVIRIGFTLTVPKSGKKSFKLAVMVQSCRPHESQHICVAEVLETRSLASMYEDCVQALHESEEAAGASQRRRPRLPVRIRVISPGMQALSRDFNEHGMQLEVEQRLEVGTELMLTLELGSKLFPKVLVPARVVWAREGGRRQHFVGVQFGELSPALQYQLAEFERFLMESQKSDIYRRQVTDFEKHINKLYPTEVKGLPADPAAPAPAPEEAAPP